MSIFENFRSNHFSTSASKISYRGEDDTLPRIAFIFRIMPRCENRKEEYEEKRSLRRREGGGILLLTLVSRLNPLAGAINILVMMSDETLRGGSGSQENELFSNDAEGKREKGRERERVKKGRDE